MKTFKSTEISFRDYLKVIFRHKIFFFILPPAIMIPVFLTMELQTMEYVAGVKMYVSGVKSPEADYYKEARVGNPTDAHVELANSNIVIERVVKSLKLYEMPVDYEKHFATKLKRTLIERRTARTKQRLAEMSAERRQAALFQSAVGRLRSKISVVNLPVPAFFIITVKDYSAERAIVIANALSRSYIIFDLEQTIAELKLEYGEKHSTVIKLEDYIEEFRGTLDGRLLPDIDAIGPASVKISEQAKEASPVKVLKKQFLLFLSFVVSLFFSAILCFVIHYLDQTFRSPQDIEKFLDIPFLGSIPNRKPKNKLLISDINPHAATYLRSYQKLSDHILLLMKDNNMKSLLITDTDGSQDNAFVVANIGVYIAQRMKHKVLIIDANFRQSSISKLFNISDSQGLIELIGNKMFFEDAVHDLGSGLHVIPTGKTDINPVALLNTPNMSDVIKIARESYELILINCAGFSKFTDAVIVSSITDGVAFVINEGKVRRQVIEEAIAPFRQKKVNMLGAILNNHKHVLPKIIYKLT